LVLRGSTLRRAFSLPARAVTRLRTSRCHTPHGSLPPLHAHLPHYAPARLPAAVVLTTHCHSRTPPSSSHVTWFTCTHCRAIPRTFVYTLTPTRTARYLFCAFLHARFILPLSTSRSPPLPRTFSRFSSRSVLVQRTLHDITPLPLPACYCTTRSGIFLRSCGLRFHSPLASLALLALSRARALITQDAPARRICLRCTARDSLCAAPVLRSPFSARLVATLPTFSLVCTPPPLTPLVTRAASTCLARYRYAHCACLWRDYLRAPRTPAAALTGLPFVLRFSRHSHLIAICLAFTPHRSPAVAPLPRARTPRRACCCAFTRTLFTHHTRFTQVLTGSLHTHTPFHTAHTHTHYCTHRLHYGSHSTYTVHYTAHTHTTAHTTALHAHVHTPHTYRFTACVLVRGLWTIPLRLHHTAPAGLVFGWFFHTVATTFTRFRLHRTHHRFPTPLQLLRLVIPRLTHLTLRRTPRHCIHRAWRKHAPLRFTTPLPAVTGESVLRLHSCTNAHLAAKHRAACALPHITACAHRAALVSHARAVLCSHALFLRAFHLVATALGLLRARLAPRTAAFRAHSFTPLFCIAVARFCAWEGAIFTCWFAPRAAPFIRLLPHLARSLALSIPPFTCHTPRAATFHYTALSRRLLRFCCRARSAWFALLPFWLPRLVARTVAVPALPVRHLPAHDH